MESFGLLHEGQPINILKQEGLRTSLFEHPEVGRQGVGAWVVEAESIATCPITGLGERLAGGPPIRRSTSPGSRPPAARSSSVDRSKTLRSMTGRPACCRSVSQLSG